MKSMVKLFAFILLTGGITLVSSAQDRTEICRGSGYHCMDVDYGGIIAKFVKGKNEPGAVIVSEEPKALL